MPTLEAQQSLTVTDEQLFYDLLRAANITAAQEGVRPIGDYTPPAGHAPEPEVRVPSYETAIGRVSMTEISKESRPNVAAGNIYYGNRRPKHFDDVPAGPPLDLKGNRSPAKSHKFSQRRPADYESRHRSTERGRVIRFAGNFLGYLAATSSITAGVVLAIPGTVH